MLNTKKKKIRYDGAQPLGVLPYIWAISIALMYTICREQVVLCSLAMAGLSTAVYMLVYSLRKRPIGAAVVTSLMTALCFCAIALVAWSFMDYAAKEQPMEGELEHTFVGFIFSASSYFDTVYAVGAIMLFSVMVGFVCCYFSAQLPRICFLLLPAFIPLILSARTAGGLPLWALMLMFGTFIPAVCCSARPCTNEDVAVFGAGNAAKKQIAAAMCLGAAAIGVALVIPRSDSTVFGQYLDSLMSGGRGFYRAAESLGNFASHSSVNTGDNSPSDRVLFTAQTPVPQNLDRWTFDVYEGADGWTYAEIYNAGYPEWELFARSRGMAALFEDLKQGARDGLLDEYAEELLRLPDLKPVNSEIYIKTLDASSATAVIMHPLGTYSVNITDDPQTVYRTAKGEMFSRDVMLKPNYLLRFNADEPCAEYSAFANDIDLLALLDEAVQRGAVSSTVFLAIKDEYNYAEAYKEVTGLDGISKEMLALAAEITRGCESDFEKAAAIERWFAENDFVYDLEFVPQSNEAEYFVFESKRGICSDFATATTLLARAAGLPARYTEGFALSEECRDENGVYNVTAANAHAYTQVYVMGCGWINLDATKLVPKAEETNSLMLTLIVVGAVVLGLAAAIIIYINRRRIALLLFGFTYPMRAKGDRIKALYLQTRRIACEISDRDIPSATAGETQKVISDMLSMRDEAEKICCAADELMYSGNIPDVDTKELYRCFKRICKRKRVLKR